MLVDSPTWVRHGREFKDNDVLVLLESLDSAQRAQHAACNRTCLQCGSRSLQLHHAPCPVSLSQSF